MSYTVGVPTITIAGQELPRDALEQFEVHSDIDQPDMAEMMLTNLSGEYSNKFNCGDPVEINMHEAGDEDDIVFKGKLIAVHPNFDVHRPPSVNLVGLNDLHELSRERKTRTYVNQTEKQIVEKVVSDHSGVIQSADFGEEPPTLLHDHLHQSNMTDLAFLRMLAARSSREVRVQDKILYFRKRQTDKDPVTKLAFGEAGKGSPSEFGGLEYFAPRMSSAAQVSKVTVRGWDPEKKQAIVGEASASASKLGQQIGSASRSDSPELMVHNVPVRTKEEADAVAQSILEERLMNFITGTAVARGNPKIKTGKVVELKCYDQRFNGKYYVTGTKHRYNREDGSKIAGGAALSGYRTEFTFKRDADNK